MVFICFLPALWPDTIYTSTSLEFVKHLSEINICMTRTLVLLLVSVALFATPTATPPTIDELRNNVIQFEHQWDRFVRKLFGCPTTGEITKENCLPGQRQLDYEAYNKARKEAIKIFDLKD